MRPPQTFRFFIFSVLISFFLTACGGGGGSEVPASNDKAVTPVDVVLPVITLIGPQSVTVVQGEAYAELGATAVDQHGNALEITLSMELDLKTVGVYVITYSVTDSNNNEVTVTRTVSVIADSVPPVITIHGENPQYITQGGVYNEAGASATDINDGEALVILNGTVDTSEAGEYTISYTATDNVGNEITVIRTVYVKEPPTPFITVWKTDNFGSTEDNQIKIMTKGSGYDYEISWGDGQKNTHVTGGITHTYAVPGTYTVSIIGDFPRIYNSSRFHMGMGNNQPIGDAEKLISIEQWGNNEWQSMSSAFMDCRNLIINATDAPDLARVTDMSYMFREAYTFNHAIGNWNVSGVTDMNNMFDTAINFNQDISQWDVSKVENMSYMFSTARRFNQNIGGWNVSNVLSMSYMFDYAIKFNQPIGDWDVSKVVSMSGLFKGAESFNQPISGWNVSSVRSMYNMFVYAEDFNQDIGNWQVSNVTNMMEMFALAVAFNQPIGNWDVSSVTNMKYMFWEAEAFDQDLSAWNVEAVKYMNDLLYRTSFSNTHYDLLLNAWSALSLQEDVTFDAGSAQYSNSAESARSVLVNTYNWSITDGGLLSSGE